MKFYVDSGIIFFQLFINFVFIYNSGLFYFFNTIFMSSKIAEHIETIITFHIL